MPCVKSVQALLPGPEHLHKVSVPSIRVLERWIGVRLKIEVGKSSQVGKQKLASKQYNSPMAMYSEDVLEEIMQQVIPQ